MLVTIQFPFADLRPFVPDSTHRLSSPDWPTPRAGVDFIRLLGQVRDRVLGGVKEWPGEHMFCDATHAIRFASEFASENVSGARRRYGRFRRFFSDGQGLARVEVGVGFRGKQPWSLLDLLAALHDAASLPVSIGRGPGAVKTKLFNARPALEKLMLNATTSTNVGVGFKPADWWMRPCEPMMLVEYGTQRESLPNPPAFRTLTHAKLSPALLTYGRMSFLGQPTGVWLFGAPPAIDRDFRHRLRIHLLRLHAQREVVKEVLRAIHKDRIKVVRTTAADADSHPSNQLQWFLRDTILRMERKEYSGLPQSELLQAIEEVQDSVTEGERTAIVQRIQPLRKSVLTAVERFTNLTGSVQHLTVVESGGNYQMTDNTQNVNVTGSVGGNLQVNHLVAEQITNALNAIQQSSATDELKNRLTELHQLVDQLVKKAPSDVQEKAAKNLEMLAKEATSPKPDRQWYEVSAEGLLDAAKAVAGMAAPMTSAVKAVLALLA